MDLLKGASSPSSEALLPVAAREKTGSGTPPTPDNQQRPAPVSTMAYARRTVMIGLLCMLVLLGFAVGSPQFPCRKGTASRHGTSDSASPVSLHQATEVGNQADEALAASILQVAKRETTNSTTDSTTVTVTQTPTSTETTTTSDSSTTSSSTTGGPTASSSTSSVTPPSSTTSVPPTSTSTSKSTTSTPPSSSSLPETTLTTSTTHHTTTTSSRPSTSKEVIQTLTSTHSDGAVVIITATTYVPAGDEPTSTTTRPVATLQNYAIRHGGSGPVLIGALGIAMLLPVA